MGTNANREASLRSVDVLRCLAALAVLATHIKRFRPHEGLSTRFLTLFPLDFGYLGVPLFVVLSGFCIHLSAARKMIDRSEPPGKSIRWGAFWRRRLVRLAPAYFAAMVLGMISYVVARPDLAAPFQKVASWPMDIAAHALMIANLFSATWAGSGDFPLWTLAMEVQLYAMYPLYLMLRRRSALAAILVPMAASAVWELATLFVLPRDTAFEWGKFPLGYWFPWALGAAVAEMSVEKARAAPALFMSRQLGLASAAFGLASAPPLMGRLAGSSWLARRDPTGFISSVLDAGTQISLLAWGVAFAVLLARWVSKEGQGAFQGLIAVRLASLGIFSYSLYLTHIPVLGIAEWLLNLGDDLYALAIRYVILAPICVAFAYAFFLAFEWPVLSSPRKLLAGAEIGAPKSPTEFQLSPDGPPP